MKEQAEVNDAHKKIGFKNSDTVYHMLRSIPSRTMTPDKIERERRFSLQSKLRKSEISRLYKERMMLVESKHKERMMSEESKKQQIQTTPVIEGNASLNICA